MSLLKFLNILNFIKKILNLAKNVFIFKYKKIQIRASLVYCNGVSPVLTHTISRAPKSAPKL